MSQAGYTPISLYYSTTASAVPLAANLAAGELAINTNDGKLYYKNSSGVVTLLAGAGGAGIVAGSNTQLQFNNSGVFGASANLTWSGTVLATTGLTATGAITLNTTTNNQSYTTTGAGTITISSGTAGSINNMSIGATTAAAGTFTSLTDSGNLTFTGTGNRITGDFSNATAANRVSFQSSTTNGNTIVPFIPNGSATQTNLILYNGSDVTTNFSLFTIRYNATAASFASSIGGTGTYVPITFETSGTEKLRIAADATGTYTFGGTAPRITGDFSNATVASRVAFQTSTANSATSIYILPNGTSTTSQFVASSNSDPTNASVFQIQANVTESQLRSGITGTGTYLPMTFYTGGSERMRLDTSGNLGIGSITYSTSQTFDQIASTRPLQVVGSSSSTTIAGSAAALTIANSDTTTSNTSQLNFAAVTGASANLYSSAVISCIFGARTNAQYPAGQLVFSTSTTLNTAPTEKMRIDSGGNVGIGSTQVSGLSLRISKGMTPGTDSGASDAYGVRVDGTIAATATNSVRLYSTFPSTVASSFTLGTLSHYQANGGTVGAGSAITSQFGFQADSGLVGATNNYGFLANDIGGASATAGKSNFGYYSALSTASGGGSAWNIYVNGTAPNYFAGNVGIGTNAPGAKLDVSSSTNTIVASRSTGGYAAFQRLAPTGNQTYDFYTINGVEVARITGDPSYLAFSTGSSATERMRIDSSGNVLVTNPAGLGYGTGSGGTVTQATSKSTGVTLNKPAGKITMNNAALLASTSVTFILTNSLVGSNDLVLANTDGFSNYTTDCVAVTGSGTAYIRVTNTSASSLSDAVVINFAIIKGASS